MRSGRRIQMSIRPLEEAYYGQTGRGWWVEVFDDAEEGSTQHYIPNGGPRTMCGRRFSTVRKRRKEKCGMCLRLLGIDK